MRVIFALLLGVAAVSFAATNLSSCGTLSTPDGVYALNQSLSSSGTCILIEANNITLDCAGFNITGTGGVDTYGIFVNALAGGSAPSLKNCRVANYSIGIYLVSWSNVLNITVYNSSRAGIWVEGLNNTLSGITAYRNADGIYLRGYSDPASTNNTLSNITSYNNSQSGIYIEEGAYSNTVSNATVFGNAYAGIYLYSWTYGNALSGITAYNNSYGISLGGGVGSSGPNIISNSTLYNNTQGLYMHFWSVTNNVYNVTATGNSQYGFYLDDSGAGCTDNNISGSTSCSNGAGGYYFAAGSTSNVGSGNKGNITDMDSNTGFSSSNCTEAQQSYYVTLNSPPDSALLGSGSVTLNWTPYGFTSNPACNVSRNGTIIFSGTCTNNQSCTTANATADGAYYWNATCSDGANANASATWQFAVDTLPPSLQMQSPQNTTYNTSSVNLNYTVSDPNIDECWYVLDGTNQSLPGCGNASVAAGEGSHDITVYANDTVGSSNLSGVSFTVDTAPPSVSIQSPANTTYNASSVNLAYAAAGATACWYSLDGGNSTALPGCANATITPSADGPHTIVVYANDSAGNIGSAGVSFTFNSLKTGIQLALKNNDMRPIYLSAMSLDGEYVAFSPEPYFPPGSRQTISFALTTPFCSYTGQLVHFNQVIIYYRQGGITGFAQAGSVPLVAKCR